MTEVKLGLVDGVQIWEMPAFPDLRGGLFKAYVGGTSGSFTVNFAMQEHFFTVSKKDVFRGMHFQGQPHEVSKVVSLVQGEAIDFLLDVRRNSSTFGHVQIQQMSQENPVSIYIPVGVAHGYLALKDNTVIFRSLGSGGTERWIIYPVIIWLMTFGAYLMGASQSQE